MHDRENNGLHVGHLLLALMGGAVAGAGVAYLTAPATGAETRQRMRLMAEDTNQAVHRMPEALKRATEAAREAFMGALDLEEEEARVTQTKRRSQKAVTAKSKTRKS